MVSDLNDEIMVSVFMITYNHDQYIAQAFDSILIQETSFRFEIVVGEDFSTDNTRMIVLEYANKYPDIFKLILPMKNIGARSNMITTLKACSGKYIAMIEGDDFWTDPLKLQKQVAFLEKHRDFSGIHHKVTYVDKDNNKLGVSDRVEKGWEVVDYRYLAQKNTIHTCSFMFKRQIIDQSVYLRLAEAPVGDLVLFLSASFYGKIGYLDSLMGAYRRNVGAMRFLSREDNFKNVIAVYCLFGKNYEMKKITNIARRYCYFKLSSITSEEGDYLQSIYYYFLMIYFTIFVVTTKESVINKVSFSSYVKTGIAAIPFANKIYRAIVGMLPK